jgi:hypothetical protein
MMHHSTGILRKKSESGIFVIFFRKKPNLRFHQPIGEIGLSPKSGLSLKLIAEVKTYR